jgi:hypothetical protein
MVFSFARDSRRELVQAFPSIRLNAGNGWMTSARVFSGVPREHKLTDDLACARP